MKAIISLTMLALLAISVPARAQRPVAPKALKAGSVYDCRLTDGTSLIFDEKGFVAKASPENMRVQIRILKTELEMTITSPSNGEIYVEKDLIVSRAWDNHSLFAIYQAPVGNIVSLALHALKNGEVIFTQSKTYQSAIGNNSNVYQSMISGKCRLL